jgi:transposase
MKPYSKDLRMKLLAAVDRGTPREEVAEVFGVSVASIKRWLKRRRETGEAEPKPKILVLLPRRVLLLSKLCLPRAAYQP